jgi:nitrogen regulatory protein P-II 1
VKKVEAIIKPFRLDATIEALERAGVRGMTVSDVRGFGQQKGHAELYSGAEVVVDLVPKVKIEVVVTDSALDDVVRLLASAARTGEVGDGKIFVLDVEQTLRIRTGETGPDAV